jgi:hypothetical protein
VFVDDLDRLNSKEIIQVLKLIRNSSSFPNTFFIVALDKSYVINSLINDKNFIDGSYLDKFFQLEVYLPEITILDLKNHFDKLLPGSNTSVIKEIHEEINNSSKLLFEYIRNYRDCIKFSNLLTLHCAILGNLIKSIDKDDLIHVLLLKARFPELYFDLVKNRSKYLKRKGQRYFLKKIKETKSENIIYLDELEGYNGVEDFSEYSMDSIISSSKIEYSYSKSEILLIKKTLLYLFANDDKRENSISYIRNFDKLTFLKYSTDDLEYDQIEDAIYKYDDGFIKNIADKKMIDQFYSVIRNYFFNNDMQIQNTLKYLSELYELDFQKQLDFERNLSIIELLFDGKLNYVEKEIEINTKEKSDWLKGILNKKTVHYDIQLKLILNAYHSANSVKTFGVNPEEIKGLMNKVFNVKINQLNNNVWEITDFSIYQIYHRIKEIVDRENLKDTFKEFLKTEKIITFCGQMLDVSFNRYNQFKLSEFVIELFGNFKAFKDFLQNHASAESPEVKEFLNFMELQDFVYYNRFLKFQFQKLPVINYKSQDHNSDYDNDLADKTYQVLVEFSVSKEDMIRDCDLGFDHSKSRFEKEDKKYIYFSNHNVDLKTMLSKIYHAYILAYSDIIDTSKSKLNKEFNIIKKDGTEFIKTKFVI